MALAERYLSGAGDDLWLTAQPAPVPSPGVGTGISHPPSTPEATLSDISELARVSIALTLSPAE
jgi:hypothetical protein